MIIDLSFISAFFDTATQFFQAGWDWINEGIYQLLKDFLVVLTKAAIYAYLKATVLCLEVAKEVVQDIFADLNFSSRVESAYNSIPSNVRSTLDFFGVPQAITVILSAIPTKLAMRFVPFIGR
ncbi:DUF2523 domain-containing protein [Pseudomonas sp. A-1]|uniref:DUF2523 family protein n=1 Tax=Pseudomonas sp. A-1 TaxID=1821274 RepID=UPI0010A62CF9|nr:DUF2523 family protein [Pseudomonas sp. A-1]THG82149.1 DUF2523 domain-containing protein [Pseudomonas sp. A-1]